MISPLTALVGILVVLLLAGVMRWAAQRLVAAFGLPAPIGVVIDVVLVVVLVLWAVRYVGAI